MPSCLLLSQTELSQKLFHSYVMVSRDRFEHTFDERSNLERIVPGNGDMMCAINLGRNTDVRSFGDQPDSPGRAGP